MKIIPGDGVPGLFRTACKGICVRHKASRPHGGSHYAAGHKRCQICCIFMKWPTNWCPCCGYHLRGRRKNVKHEKIPIEQRANVVVLENGVPIAV